MKKIKKMLAIAMAACLITGVGTYTTGYLNKGIEVYASVNEGKNFEVPTYVYGVGLSKDEIRRTAEALGIQSLEGMTVVPITGAELDKYIGNSATNTPDNEMISSVAVVKEAEGSGVEVVITTPENISQIQKYQYENAAITAGIKDVYVAVGSIKRVTGESALAGIYKAFEVNNIALDKERMEVAQKELEVTNKLIQSKVAEAKIAEPQATTEEVKKPIEGKKVINGSNNTNSNNNNSNSNNNDSNNNNVNSNNVNSNNVTNNIQNNINQVMIDIKSELGSKAMAGVVVSEEEINKIVEAKLAENKVDGFTPEQLAQLATFFKDYNDKVAQKAATDGTSQKQLEKLSEKVTKETKSNGPTGASFFGDILNKSNNAEATTTTVATEAKKEETTVEATTTTVGSGNAGVMKSINGGTKADATTKAEDKKEETTVEATTTTEGSGNAGVMKSINGGTKADATTKAEEKTTTVEKDAKVTTVEDKKTTEAQSTKAEDKATTKAEAKESTQAKADKNGVLSYEGFNKDTLSDKGFVKADLPKEVKSLLVNFDSKDILYFKSANPIKVNEVNPDTVNALDTNNEYAMAVAEDFILNIKDNKDVLYKQSKDDAGIKHSTVVTGTKLGYLNLSTEKENVKANGSTSKYVTLNQNARTLLNAYVNTGDLTSDTASRYILDLMAKEENSYEANAVVVDLGEGILVYTIDNGEAKVWYLDKASKLKIDLNNKAEYVEKVLTDGKFTSGAKENTDSTTNKSNAN